jgi:hypothetical protein
VVLKRRTKRAPLRRSDRLFWVLLHRVWSQWSNPLLIVKPDTVIRWHRTGFRLYWRFRSRSKRVGRPVNHLSILLTFTSGALHESSDEECAQKFDGIREVFELTFRRLEFEIKEAAEYSKVLGKFTGRQRH